MNRRDFLRGSTALGLAALTASKASAAGFVAVVPPEVERGLGIVRKPDPVFDAITKRALQLMEASLKPMLDRWEHDLMAYGSVHWGAPKIRFRRPVEFRVVDPIEMDEPALYALHNGVVARRLVTKAELKHFEETGTWP